MTAFSRHFLCKLKTIYLTTGPTTYCTAEFMEQIINFIEFSAALNSLKGITRGYDKINFSVIKYAAKPLKNRIVLFNSILRSNVPQTYKVSTIVPIHKPGKEKTLIESYRPISLNPCKSKILDKIISKRLWWFVATNKLLNSHQLGFRKGESVTDFLLFVDALVSRALSEKDTIISLDFQKAFEKLELHTIICHLKAWGCGQTTLIYVSNFMTNRKSEYERTTPNLHNGIPQGSSLAVILFFLY